MSMNDTLPPLLDEALRTPSAAAAKSGRPVVAFMSNNVPVELIHAAGCFPLQLPTAKRPHTPRADRYLERRFDPLVRVALEQLLAGDYPSLSLLVLPRANDSMQRLYYYLCELRRSFGERLPEPFLYDVLHTPWYSTSVYDHARTVALKQRLEQLGGRVIDDPALSASIRLYNGVRSRIDALLQRRRGLPCTLSGELARSLFVAAQRVAPEAFCALLDRVLSLKGDPAHGVRTLLIGSAHDTAALHRLIAEAGGQVVADHHWLGDDLFGRPIDERLPPLRALAMHYHRDSPSPRTFAKRAEEIEQLARAARAEAAVFFHYAEEEALTWDIPAQQRALDALGIPVLRLAKQPYTASSSVAPSLSAFFSEALARPERSGRGA